MAQQNPTKRGEEQKGQKKAAAPKKQETKQDKSKK